jgi:CCR4-NOT transcription complex subunit 1
VLIDLGPASSLYEIATLVEVLKDFSKTSLRGLAHTLIAISNHFTSQDNQKNLETITMKCNMRGDMTYMNEDPSEYPINAISWNIETLSQAFREVYAGAAWTELIKFLDVDMDARDEFYFQSQEAFNTFMDLWNNLKPHNKTFPVEFLIANAWKNKRAHVTCLDYAINYSYKNNDILFEKAKKRTETLTTLQNIKPQAQPYLRVWKCVDLVQSLVNLSDSQYFFRVRQIFDIPLKYIPEYLLLTLTKIKTKAGRFLLEDLYSPLLPTFLTGHVNSIPILTEVWNADKNMMITAMSELYKINPKNMNLSRVLDITQSIKNSLLDIITTSKDYNFALQLGMLGAKRDFLHFEHWIEKLIRQEGDPFVRSLLKYIDLNLLRPAFEVFEDKKKVEKVLERSQLTEGKFASN